MLATLDPAPGGIHPSSAPDLTTRQKPGPGDAWSGTNRSPGGPWPARPRCRPSRAGSPPSRRTRACSAPAAPTCGTYFFPTASVVLPQPGVRRAASFDDVELSRTGHRLVATPTPATSRRRRTSCPPTRTSRSRIAAVELAAEGMVVLGQVVAGRRASTTCSVGQRGRAGGRHPVQPTTSTSTWSGSGDRPRRQRRRRRAHERRPRGRRPRRGHAPVGQVGPQLRRVRRRGRPRRARRRRRRLGRRAVRGRRRHHAQRLPRLRRRRHLRPGPGLDRAPGGQSCYAACASGATGPRRRPAPSILAGLCDVALVVGADTTPKGFLAPVGGDRPDDPDWLRFRLLGATNPTYFALYARRRMDLYGATDDDFATVKVKNARHGLANPNARYRKEVTVEDVLASPMVADPLRLLDICATSDGGAAVVLTSMEFARAPRRPTRCAVAAVSTVTPTYPNTVIEMPNFATDSAAAWPPPERTFKRRHRPRRLRGGRHRPRGPRRWPRSTTCPPRSSSTGTRTSACASQGEAERLLRDGDTDARRPHPGQPQRRARLLRRGRAGPGHRPGVRGDLAAARPGRRPPGRGRHASASPPTRACSATAPACCSCAEPGDGSHGCRAAGHRATG